MERQATVSMAMPKVKAMAVRKIVQPEQDTIFEALQPAAPSPNPQWVRR